LERRKSAHVEKTLLFSRGNARPPPARKESILSGNLRAGLAIHEMGTARQWPPRSEDFRLNEHNQAHDAKNLFLTNRTALAWCPSSCVKSVSQITWR